MPGIRAAINQIESSDMQAEWRKHLAAQVKPRTFCATECCNGIAMHKFGDIYYCEDCHGFLTRDPANDRGLLDIAAWIGIRALAIYGGGHLAGWW